MGGQLARPVEHDEPLDLAPIPDRSTRSHPSERIYVTLLTAVEPMLRGEDPGLRAQRTPGFDLVLAAAVAARTPRASSPSLDEIRAVAPDG
jgi:hypothetical protein